MYKSSEIAVNIKIKEYKTMNYTARGSFFCSNNKCKATLCNTITG